jgi:hypothetical protein
MVEKNYPHRSAVDKLGLVPGMRVRMTGNLGDELKIAAKSRIGGSLLRSGDLDMIVRAVNSVEEADEFVERVRPQLSGGAALWLVTRKQGDSRYVKQEDLIPVGKAHGLVDNKICSIDAERSAMRFVIPRDRR